MKKLLFITIFVFTPIFATYAADPVKILIVPGHDNEIWGAQYGNLKEADMNLAVATNIYNALKKDKKFKVYITRDAKGYKKEFADYLSKNQEEIIAFRDEAKLKRQEHIESGDFVEKENVPHNDASEKVSVTLYGINKWANENDIDAVIHVHFNDYPRTDKWTMGVHKGFAIYMPEEQMKNSEGSVDLAESIFKELRSRYITSTYLPEAGGLIPDQSLIALGSNGSLSTGVRSLLIEYGYIYRFGNSESRNRAFSNMATLTVRGIKNYFLK